MGFLNDDGVLFLWNKIKSMFVVKVSGKGLSTNDYTTTEKNKLAGLSNYTHPSYTARSNDLYKLTVDSTGHVSSVVKVTKSDITGLGIPAQDTLYSLFLNGNQLSLVGGDGSVESVTLPTSKDTNTTYTLTKSGNKIILTGSDGTKKEVEDSNTTYSNASASSDGLMAKADYSKLAAFGAASTYALKTDIVTYSLVLVGNNLSLVGGDGTVETVTIPTSGGGSTSSITVTDDGDGNVTIWY